MSWWKGAVLVVVVLATALAVGARADDAPAADLAARVADLEASVAKDAAAKDEAALAKDAEAVLALSDGISDAALRARLVDVAGKVLAASHEEAVQRPAVRALGRLGDPAGFVHLRRFLLLPTPEALDAAAKMKVGASVAVLLAIVDRSSDWKAAVAAMKGLEAFGGNKAVRGTIVKELTASLRKSRPGISYRRRKPEDPPPTPPQSSARYEALAGEMCAVLNRLTGQNVASPEDWFDLAEKYKTSLEALFFGKAAIVAPPVEKASPEVVARVEAFEKAAAATPTAESDAARVASAVALAAQTTDPAMRTRLADVVGAILERASDEALDRAAVKALGEIGDPKSYRFLRPRFAAWESNDLRLEAIAAAGAGRSPQSLPVLLALVEHAETAGAVAALKALAGFWRDKGRREAVVLGIADTVRRARAEPSVPRPPPCIPWPEGEQGRYQTDRYRTLAWEMTSTLNAMTGRNLPDPGSWFDLVAENREKPSALFLAK